MKKVIVALLVSLLICTSLIVCASAKSDMYVVDPEYLLSEDEWSYLESYAGMIEDNYGYCVMFAVTNDVSDSGSTAQYCKDVYMTFSNCDDGFIIAHNIADQNYSWYCSGKGNEVFTEDVIDHLWTEYGNGESYYGGIYAFFEAAEVVVENAGGVVFDNSTASGGYLPEAGENWVAVKEKDFVPVERTLPLVVDNADLLTDEEEKEFNDRLEAFANEYESEIAILTVTDLEGRTARDYADDFYDYNGYGYGENDDGMLVLYKPGVEGERELYITTHGTGIDDYYADDFIDAMVDHLISEDYVSAFNTYIEVAESSHKFSVNPMWIIFSIVFGMLVGFIIPKSMASANKTVRPQRDASVYSKQGSMVITGNSDVFITSNITRVAKPKNNSSGGTHTSSSGRSHGGGGAKF